MKSLFKWFSNEPKPFTIIEPTYEWEGNKGRSPSGQFNLHMFDKVISETFLTFERHEAYPLRTLRFAAYSFMLDQPISYVKSKEGFNFWFENKSSLPDAQLKSELSSKNLSENAFKDMNEWLPMYAVGKVRSEVASVPFSGGVIDVNEKKRRAKRFLRTFGQLFLSDASSTMWAEVDGDQPNSTLHQDPNLCHPLRPIPRNL
ncbi:hypothetical protein [Roseinatronobacter monicus]|uniref:Uncharacterized protein n=1 Tax=Roseinatronobacter monicus TaxID=393481 RepID=A0A543KFH4_9RHOB|nr:hypothetical protein [Roseinatronobacter monicus]TQM93777.1 hypothetical protein BD293_2426 [Roseinatronobacter monicus]